jgi:hypothetical protein
MAATTAIATTVVASPTTLETLARRSNRSIAITSCSPAITSSSSR